MQLPGRLDTTTLGDLLGALHREEANGVLRLEERAGVNAGRHHDIELRGGLIAEVKTPLGGKRLGERLVEAGLLNRRELLRLEPALSGGVKLGALAMGRALLAPGALASALRDQYRERLEALFGLRDAAIRFHVSAGRKRERLNVQLFSPVEFLHGRPRARARVGAHRDSRVDAGALETLGLRPGATNADVRQAFRSLARRYHPDCHPDADPVERGRLLRRFAEITRAYHAVA